MVENTDLRETPSDQHRETLFHALTEAEPGDGFEVVSDEDIDSHLVRYQLEKEERVVWEYDDPDAEPREVRVTKEGTLDDDLAEIDVRDLKPQRRHEALLEIFDELNADEGFVLVNDHDPKPLYYELRSMHGDVIEWEYRERASDVCRVEVVKTEESTATDNEVITRYDVREIPKPDRHPAIHHRYGMVPEGGSMEIVAPHEPRPLHQEFRESYGETFDWEVVENEPGECRVRITKVGNTGGETDEGEGDGEEAEIRVEEELDVRDLPPAERHEKIFAKYDGLDRGKGFVLVNDHDPKPLYHQFEAEAGPEFKWKYQKKKPDEFRVLIGKSPV